VSRLLYADTSALIALVYAGDQAHERVAEHFRALRSSGDRLITSDTVVGETATRLRYDAGLPLVHRFRSVLERSAGSGTLTVRESSTELRRAAFDIVDRYADLRISYADAVGAVIARERRVDAVFGLDNDFRIMGFTMEP
jgi:predicted nucleic acid-binding protein